MNIAKCRITARGMNVGFFVRLFGSFDWTEDLKVQVVFAFQSIISDAVKSVCEITGRIHTRTL